MTEVARQTSSARLKKAKFEAIFRPGSALGSDPDAEDTETPHARSVCCRTSELMPWLSLSEAGHARGHFLVRVGKAAHS